MIQSLLAMPVCPAMPVSQICMDRQDALVPCAMGYLPPLAECQKCHVKTDAFALRVNPKVRTWGWKKQDVSCPQLKAATLELSLVDT